MHRCQPGGIRNMVVSEGEFHTSLLRHPARFQFFFQIQDKPGDPFIGCTAAEIHGQLIGLMLFLEAGARHHLEQIVVTHDDGLQIAAPVVAICDIGDCFHQSA